MEVTARALNRATLARQLLLDRQRLGVVEAMHRVVAIQAQQPASPYLALWNRLIGFDPADLDAAFASHAVVKATLMRITQHAVPADDYPVFHRAMQPTLRASGLHDRRFKETGLTIAEADALVPDLLEFAGRPRQAAEINAWLEARLGVVPGPGLWRALRCFAPLLHAPMQRPWSFGARPSYLAARTALGDGALTGVGASPDESLPWLVRRYLEGFGPASVADVARFALVQRQWAKAAISALSDELEELDGPDGVKLFDVPAAPRPAEDALAPPRLMAMWDSVLLAYADRGRVIPPDYRALVTRVNGDVLPTLLVDGYVAGVWRPVDGGIEATAFHRLPAGAWDGLAAEAEALTVFLAGRDPAVYRRYDHWWAKLPAPAETKVLPHLPC